MYDTRSIRRTVLVGAVMLFLGAALRALANTPDLFWLVVFAQTFGECISIYVCYSHVHAPHSGAYMFAVFNPSVFSPAGALVGPIVMGGVVKVILFSHGISLSWLCS